MTQYDGLANRCPDSVTPCQTTTYDNPENGAAPGAALSAQNDGEKAPPANSESHLDGLSNVPDVPQCAPSSANNPDLAAVVAAWPTLPEAVRAGIVAMVRASARDV